MGVHYIYQRINTQEILASKESYIFQHRLQHLLII